MAKKQKLKKGSYGYINYKRRTQPLLVLLYICIGLAIFFLGLVLNKFEKENIFTILAFLMILPATKKLVNGIVFLPYRTIPVQLQQKVENSKKPEDIVFYDAVFTSPQKVMFLAVLAVAGNEVIGLTGRKKEEKEYIEKYLKDSIKKRGWAYKVSIITEESVFLKKLDAADRNLIREEQKELLDYLKSLLVE